jgi:hypothetical protein
MDSHSSRISVEALRRDHFWRLTGVPVPGGSGVRPGTPGMSGRFASVVQQQATTMVPGALFAFALTLPLTRHRVLWHLKVEEVYFELHDIILYASDLMLLVVIATWLLTPARGRVKALTRWLLFALLALPLLAAISATPGASPLPGIVRRRLALLLGLFRGGDCSEARGALAGGTVSARSRLGSGWDSSSGRMAGLA